MRGPVVFNIALRYLFAGRRHRFGTFVSLVSVLGVAVGVAVLVIVISVMNGFEREVRAHVLSMTSHSLLMSTAGPIESWQTLRDEVLSVPDVIGAAPYIRAGAMLSHRGAVRGVSVAGIDARLEPGVSDLVNHLAAVSAKLVPGSQQVYLGYALARDLGVEPGDTLTLIAPRWSRELGLQTPRYQRLVVADTFRLGMNEFDAGLAVLNIEDAAAAFGLGNAVSGLKLRFPNPDAAPRIAREVLSVLGPPYAAIDWTQFHRNFFLAVGSQKRMMFVILTLIMAVAAFNIVAAMVMLVYEKRSEIAILRTLGLRPRAVMAVFLIEGLLIGSAGASLGTGLGVWGANRANALVQWIERMFGVRFIKPDVYYIDYLPADLRVADITVIALTAFVICLAATVFPAWNAARTDPARALRYD